MTLEEKAKQKANELAQNQTLGIYDDDESLAYDKGYNSGEVAGYEEGYIDGTQENGIRWHDLRKDPNDLPVLETELLCQKYSGRCFVGFKKNGNFYSHETGKSYDIVRWADIGTSWQENIWNNK